jgi:hypothetical protein
MWYRIGWVLLLCPQWLLAEGLHFSYQLESFRWQEYELDPVGHQLEESGFRHRFALYADKSYAPQWQSDAAAHLTLGSVAYDGWSGEVDGSGNLYNRIQSDTEYFGYGLEAGFSYFPAGVPGGITAGAGGRLAFGIDTWDRTLLGGGGYKEHYVATYGRLAGIYLVPTAWRLEVGAKLPLATSESVDLTAYGYSEVAKLNPRGQPSLYVTWRYQLNERAALSLDYDGYRFAKSNDDIIYNTLDSTYYAVHQPRSEMHTLGVAISLSL